MKRLMTLLIALLLAAMPALAEPQSRYDFYDDILEDGSPLYSFPEISLQLPASWQGKVMAVQQERGTDFFQIASYEKYAAEGVDNGGFLFRLSSVGDDSYEQLPDYRYLGVSERSGMHYYLMLPSDYSAYNDPDIRAEYDAMMAQIDIVADNAEIYPPEDVGGTQEVEPSAEASAAPAGGVNASDRLSRVRYHFEHSALPRYFHEAPDNVLAALSDPGVYTLWASLATENGVDPTYPVEDYVVNWYSAGDAVIAMAEMPDPEATTQCYRVYFVQNGAEARYFTAESNEFAPGACFICEWTKEMEHVNYGGLPLTDKEDRGYGRALLEEAGQIAKLVGIEDELYPMEGVPGPVETPKDPDDSNLARIECPEQGFSIMADPAYPWDYREGTGISVYTGTKGNIPYVIVYQGDDLYPETYELIREQYTPHIKKQYGEDLVSFEEYENYDIGGKQLAAGVYTYRLQGHLIDLIRLYDSTGKHTVSFTAKYIQGQGDATLEALDTAVRTFRAE